MFALIRALSSANKDSSSIEDLAYFTNNWLRDFRHLPSGIILPFPTLCRRDRTDSEVRVLPVIPEEY